MKIGIIVYSQTGNTHAVALRIKEKLELSGHAAEIQRVTMVGKAAPRVKDCELDCSPAVDRYDALLFGAPVQAFTLATPMAVYLERLPSLRGKPVACFVTKQLPGKWTGANSAIGRMKKICLSKGANFRGSAVVWWLKSKREKTTAACIDYLCSLFNQGPAKE